MNARSKKRKSISPKRRLLSAPCNQYAGPSVDTQLHRLPTASTHEHQPSLPKKPRQQQNASEDQATILATCAAAVRITKSLLGYGSENNWLDVERSKGRSWIAGDYRRNWLYVSAKNHLSAPDLKEEGEKENKEETFYYYPPTLESIDKKLNIIVRKAVCAILAHSGSCDEHAYVLATLLRQLLPIGTPINICAFKNNQAASDFPHTFVVIGNAQNEGSRPSGEDLTKYHANDRLIVADAWPIRGGAIPLKDFFLRKNTHSVSRVSYPLSLRIDHTFYADGKDHLTHKINKQRTQIRNAAEKRQGYTFLPSTFFFPHHELEEQYRLKIPTMPLHGYRGSPGMWEANSIAYQNDCPTEPENTSSVLQNILKSYPDLKALLEQTDEELGIDEETPDSLLPRFGSGFSN